MRYLKIPSTVLGDALSTLLVQLITPTLERSKEGYNNIKLFEVTQRGNDFVILLKEDIMLSLNKGEDFNTLIASVLGLLNSHLTQAEKTRYSGLISKSTVNILDLIPTFFIEV